MHLENEQPKKTQKKNKHENMILVCERKRQSVSKIEINGTKFHRYRMEGNQQMKNLLNSQMLSRKCLQLIAICSFSSDFGRLLM